MTDPTNFVLKDILENTAHPDGKKSEQIFAGDALEICFADILLINSKIDATYFCMALGAPMMEAGRTFLNVKCERDSPALYVNGNKSHEYLTMMQDRFNTEENGPQLLTEDMLPDGQELNFMNQVLQERTLEYVESADVKAIIFDDSASLLRGPFGENDIKGLRRFMVKLRQKNILQVWALTHEKSKLKFPIELATSVWQISPGKDLTASTLELQILKDLHRPTKALGNITLEIQETEDGLILANASAERNDRLTAMLLVSRGKTQSEVAELLSVHQSTISLWLKSYKERGLMSQTGHSYSLTETGQKYLEGQNS